MKPALKLLDGEFTVHRLDPAIPIPAIVTGESFCWVARTDEELSVVCRSALEVDSTTKAPGWICLKVQGPLDFALTGVLAGIATVLADTGVSIVALSTFETDYILVKKDALHEAVSALREAGYTIG